jgi:TonB family protein
VVRFARIFVLGLGLFVACISSAQKKPDGSVRISCPSLQATPVKIVRPIYPELAKQAKVEGKVSLRCFVGKDGAVERIEVKKGHPLLSEAATRAVSQWKYKPLVLNGKAVEIDTTVDVIFQLPKAPEVRHKLAPARQRWVSSTSRQNTVRATHPFSHRHADAV